MRVYFGTVGWGWKMYGVGYKDVWFLGLSKAIQFPRLESLLPEMAKVLDENSWDLYETTDQPETDA